MGLSQQNACSAKALAEVGPQYPHEAVPHELVMAAHMPEIPAFGDDAGRSEVQNPVSYTA